jgi:hypothetical protein
MSGYGTKAKRHVSLREGPVLSPPNMTMTLL